MREYMGGVLPDYWLYLKCMIIERKGMIMKKTGLWKKAVSGTLAAGLVVSMTACGGGKAADTAVEPGTASSDTSQTDFTAMAA